MSEADADHLTGLTATSWDRIVPLLLLLIGLSATVSVSIGNRANRARAERDSLDLAASEARTLVDRQLRDHVSVLYGLQAELSGGAETLTELQRHVERANLLRRFDALQAVSFSPLIPAVRVPTFGATIADEWARQAPGELVGDVSVAPVTGRDAAPVSAIVPLVGNERVLGYDLLSDPVRRAAVIAARDRGEPVATSPVRLRQTGRPGLLVVAAVYDADRTAPQTTPERRRAYRGVFVLVFDRERLLNHVLGDQPRVRLTIADVGPIAGPETPPSPVSRQAAAPGPVTTLDLDVAGRRWRLTASPMPGLSSTSGSSTPVVLAGLAITATVVAAARRALVERSRQARVQLRQSLEFSPDPLVVTDADHVVRYANHHALDLLGLEAADVVGHPATRWWPDVGEPGPTDRASVVGADGLHRTVDVRSAPLTLGQQHLRITALRDVTERDRVANEARDLLESALDRERDALEALQQSERAKDNFLDHAAHELRTPLTAIIGFTHVLAAAGDVEEPAATWLQRLQANADQLSEMVDRLLDFSRLRSGRVVLTPVDHAVVPALVAVAERQGVDLAVTGDPAVTASIDPAAFEHIMGNLVSNASKYSPPDRSPDAQVVVVDAEVRIEVRDHGPGVAPADVPHLFERFFRSQTQAPGVRGTGVGLTIAAEYAAASHGRVWYEPADGGGSRFWVSLPAAAVGGLAGDGVLVESLRQVEPLEDELDG